MEIYAQPGTKVKFIESEPSQAQINWGGHTDPTDVLEVGKEYVIDHTDVRSSHTKVFLEGFEGVHFNSVWFK